MYVLMQPALTGLETWGTTRTAPRAAWLARAARAAATTCAPAPTLVKCWEPASIAGLAETRAASPHNASTARASASKAVSVMPTTAASAKVPVMHKRCAATTSASARTARLAERPATPRTAATAATSVLPTKTAQTESAQVSS